MRRFSLCLATLLFLVISHGNAMETKTYYNAWIKVSQVRQAVYRIQERDANCYLVVGKEDAVMIDTGYGAVDLQKICRDFTQLPITVVNTHGHFDHTGGDQYFSTVFIHKDDAPELEKVAGSEGRNLMKMLQLELNFPKNVDLDKWYDTPTQPARLLSGGELLQFSDIRMEVLHTPGHTPGSICLLDRERRLLFIGDSFNLAKAWTSLPEDDLKEWLNKTGLRSQVDIVLSGHLLPMMVGKDI